MGLGPPICEKCQITSTLDTPRAPCWFCPKCGDSENLGHLFCLNVPQIEAYYANDKLFDENTANMRRVYFMPNPFDYVHYRTDSRKFLIGILTRDPVTWIQFPRPWTAEDISECHEDTQNAFFKMLPYVYEDMAATKSFVSVPISLENCVTLGPLEYADLSAEYPWPEMHVEDCCIPDEKLMKLMEKAGLKFTQTRDECTRCNGKKYRHILYERGYLERQEAKYGR